MTNLELAQEIHDDAKTWLTQQLMHLGNGKIDRAVDVLGMLIEENRTLRDRLRVVADTMNYALPGGR